jgi:hypothetical protein
MRLIPKLIPILLLVLLPVFAFTQTNSMPAPAVIPPVAMPIITTAPSATTVNVINRTTFELTILVDHVSVGTLAPQRQANVIVSEDVHVWTATNDKGQTWGPITMEGPHVWNLVP